MKTASSALFMVLTRKRLSNEKKKKEPDFPADSLALKTYCLFLAASKLSKMSLGVTLSISFTTSNKEGLYSMMFTYSFIYRPLSSVKVTDFRRSAAITSGSDMCSDFAIVALAS